MNWIGIGILLAEYLSWAFLTVSYKSSIALIAAVITSVLCSCIWNYSMRRLCQNKTHIEHNQSVLKQLRSVNWIILAVNVIGLVYVVCTGVSGSNIALCIAGMVWIISTTLCIYNVQLPDNQRISIRKTIRNALLRIYAVIRNNKAISVLLVMVIVLSVDPDWRQYKWDGYLYYISSHNIDITSISSTAIYGHIAQTYGVLAGAFVGILHNVSIGMLTANIFMLLICTIYTYRIFGIIFGRYLGTNTSTIYRVLMTAICVFSPFYLGMVDYYSLDYYLMCILPAVVYYMLSEEWILMTVSACFFVFTKEPAVIFYGGLVAGMCIVSILGGKDSSGTIGSRILAVLKSPKYYYLATPGVLWLLTYKLLGPWSAGDGAVAIDIGYIIDKLKCLYILNFGWVFLTILFICAIICIVKRPIGGRHIIWIIPIATGTLAFTAFCCVFRTVNHPRYVDAAPLMLYIISLSLLTVVIGRMSSLRYGISVILSLILITSSYITVDPVSLLAFDSVSTGSGRLIKTMESPLGDGSIYNRQMLGLEHVLNRALGEAAVSGTTVVMPMAGDSEYYFDGTAYYGVDYGDVYYQTEYYNLDAMSREFCLIQEIPEYITGSIEADKYESVDGLVALDVFMADAGVSMEDIDKLARSVDNTSGGSGSSNRDYMILYINDEIQPQALGLVESLDIHSTFQYDYRGWTLHAVTGSLK